MPQQTLRIAGLETQVVAPDAESPVAVILLHGYAMDHADLAPFGDSMNFPARFFFPRGPRSAVPHGYAWWDVDTLAREQALRRGARDLANERPPGLTAARRQLDDFITALQDEHRPHRIVLGGFSQGGMLACDAVLHGAPAEALVLLSASLLHLTSWEARRARLRNLPAFVSHGRSDSDLAFTAGERLRDFVIAAGARVTWAPFDGGHEIPLPVWRALRKFFTASLSGEMGLLNCRP